MIYKCPNCNGALEFNPLTEQLECSHCGNGYSIQQIENDSPNKGSKNRQKRETDKIQSKEPETMECQIYTCTSCGGELMVSDAEVSTYCAYCGQPTIVFSRISNELKPDNIIPFKISKEQAVEGIRERLKKGFFVPREIKNFEVEKVRGIYVPYWLYNIHYYDKQIVAATNKKSSLAGPFYIYEAEAEYNKVLLDASKQLNDETSMKLEPYDLRLLKEFKPAYMSGFYADRADQKGDEHKRRAALRVKTMFDEEAREDVSFSIGPFGYIVKSEPRFQIKNEKYALLPAWFLTFRYKNEPYTMLVNGQTGKIVGSVPLDKKKVLGLATLIAIISSGAFYFAWHFIFTGLKWYGPAFWGIILLIMLVIVVNFYVIGIRIITGYKKNIGLTRSKQTEQYVKERQDET